MRSFKAPSGLLVNETDWDGGYAATNDRIRAGSIPTTGDIQNNAVKAAGTVLLLHKNLHVADDVDRG